MNFFTELKRRNVYRVGAAYIVASWLVIEVSSVVLPVFGAPVWILKLLMVFVTVGFVCALMLSWLFEITPEGIKLEADVDRSQSITSDTAKKLDRLTIVLIVVVLLVIGIDRLVPEQSAPVVQSGSNGVEQAAQPSASSAPSQPLQATSNSIAVLPFINMSADAENEFFADGIAEELLNLLAGVQALEVASRTSAFAFKGKGASIPEIAGALKVRYVLEGSVRKAGEQVRITAQLIDAVSDRHLWSQTYDRTLSDIFAIQDEIAVAIGRALQVKLLGTGGQAVNAEAIDPALYEDFLEARFLLRRRSNEAIERASELLREVVAAAPDFARGSALLAEADLLTGPGGSDKQDQRLKAEAESLARHAMDLAPGLATPYMILGWLAHLQRGDLITAHQYFLKAIELEPDEPRPHHWLAILYGVSGYLDQALTQINEALRLEPGNANVWGWRADVYASLGRIDEALGDALEQARLGNPADGYAQAGLLEILRGNPDAARGYFSQRPDDDAIDWQQATDLTIAAAVDASRLDELLAFLDANRGQGDYYPRFRLAALGADAAFLGRFKANDFFIHPIVWSPQRKSLRQNPGFIALLESHGDLALWRKLGPPPDCRPAGDSFTCGHGYPEGYAQ